MHPSAPYTKQQTVRHCRHLVTSLRIHRNERPGTGPGSADPLRADEGVDRLHRAAARYGLTGLIAAAVFLFGTLMNEFVLARNRPNAARIAAVVAASLALSFGIGMLSGGLQHFEDFPDRGTWLIPAGLVVSFVAYVLRYDAARWRSVIRLTGAAVAITAAVAFFGLRGLAADLTAESAGGGGHSHGADESADSPAEPAPSTDAAATP
ncbi:hypothetical protein ACWC5I_42475, partial [Kitasatospora sp. NPDC001574]